MAVHRMRPSFVNTEGGGGVVRCVSVIECETHKRDMQSTSYISRIIHIVVCPVGAQVVCNLSHHYRRVKLLNSGQTENPCASAKQIRSITVARLYHALILFVLFLYTGGAQVYVRIGVSERGNRGRSPWWQKQKL